MEKIRNHLYTTTLVDNLSLTISHTVSKVSTMRTAIVFVVCLIAYVTAETCSGNNNLDTQCSHLTCDQGWHLACNSGQCTCVQNTANSCTTKAECDAVSNWECPMNRRHCIDGTCRCTRF
ncbi:Hypothetical predicted protein [Mytilus galloprovincialis]|uniref:Uncharacterized protein n=1 Tax=Mytilus galloprovincialis TaxID=29158 RepID=A0A8B6E204_MYTGA|nr:Hypothetical predicted protein [Mytilus galloprovincialis]